MKMSVSIESDIGITNVSRSYLPHIVLGKQLLWIWDGDIISESPCVWLANIWRAY